MNLVIDASACIDLVLNTTASVAILDRCSGATLHAPELVDLEILNVLRRLEARRSLASTDAEQAYARLARLPVKRHGHRPLLPGVWELRGNVSSYDAAYATLARLLDVPLVTRDRRLANAPGLGCAVEVL